MQDPKIILADEPIASLDPMNAQIVMQTLRRIMTRTVRTIICNLHTLDTARRYCDRVVACAMAGRLRWRAAEADGRRGARDLRADEDFSEAATSTEIETLEPVVPAPVAARRPTANSSSPTDTRAREPPAFRWRYP